MPVLALNEPLVAALVDRLVAELPDAVDELNAAVTDGWTIDHPAEVLPYVPSPALLTDFPTLGIQDFPSRFEDDIGSSATAVHRLGVVFFLVDADLGGLALQLRRYARVVATVALRSRQLGPAWSVTLDQYVPGPTLEDEEDPRTWLSFAAITIDAKVTE